MTWKGMKPSKFTLEVVAAADERVRMIAGDMLSGVVSASPVDTGAFRANHRVSVNSEDNSVGEANNSGAIKSAKFGDVIYIQNNLPYAERLENGWSGQAPVGVYGVTFSAVSEKYRK